MTSTAGAEKRSDTPLPRRTMLDAAVPITFKDGRTLVTYRAGSADASDLVLFESGATTAGAYWGPTVEAIEAQAAAAGRSVQIVAYDRAGYGSSSPFSDWRTLDDMANDLGELLDQLDFDRAVLAGHSWGGPICRVAASRRDLNTIAGIALVDATDEHCENYYTWYLWWMFWARSWLFQPWAIMGTYRQRKEGMLAKFPEPYRAAALEAGTTYHAARASAYELSKIPAQLRWLLDNPAHTGDVNVTVISGQKMLTPGSMREKITNAHKDRAERMGELGKYVPAHNSAHNIPNDEPELIARECLAFFGWE